MKIASVSELKDGLSAHLDRVRAGETVVVTAHKTPVATLRRIPPGLLKDEAMALVAGEIVEPPKERLVIDELFAMPRGRCAEGNLSTAILEERREGR